MFFTAMAINSHSLRQTHIGRRFSTKMQGLWAGFKGLRGSPKKKHNILRIFIWFVVSTPLKNISQLGSVTIPNIWKVIKFMFQTSNQLPCVTSSPFHFVSWLNRRQGEAVQSWFNYQSLMRLVPAGPAHGSCHCSVQRACNYSITWWFIYQVFIASIHFPPRISMHFLVNFPILPACETPPLSGFHRGVHPQRGLWPSGQVWQSNRNS